MTKSPSIPLKLASLLFLVILAGSSCGVSDNPPDSLKEAFRNDFLIGTAVGPYLVSGRDSMGLELLDRQFNSITAGNAMKWEQIHPRPGVYDFGPADLFVEFGEKHHMDIVGHCLVWHSQTPSWVFSDEAGNPVSRDTLLQRMHDHILTVMGRYRDRVHTWDVVNEPIGDDGQLRRSPWSEIIGDDFVQKAFEYAREADPDAVLILNDYSLPTPRKRDGMVRLIKELQSSDIRVDVIGMQGHYQLYYPSMEDLESAILAFKELGCRVMITELDINVLPNPRGRLDAEVSRREEFQARYDPYAESLPDSVSLKLAEIYGNLFRVFVKNADVIDRVTFWGLQDGYSWKNNWPVPGRTNYPLLFDRQYRPKLAYDYVMKAAGDKE
jgi:endo-1,4-beta-xylanase